jgi:hypothetical protein
MARPIAVAQPMAVRPGPGAAAPNVNTSARAIAQPTGGAIRRPSATQQQQRPSAVAAAAPSGGVVRPAPAMPSGPPPSRPVAQAAQSVAKGGGKAPPAKKSK